MAEVGKGDPRWIVDPNRPDTTNVKNWHWKEKDATLWSQNKLSTFFKETDFNSNIYQFKLKDDIVYEGFAHIYNRKGKLFYVVDYGLKLKWKGKNIIKNQTIEGNIEIRDLEYDLSKVEIEFDVETGGKDPFLKKFLEEEVKMKLQNIFKQYRDDLVTKYSNGLILPTESEEVKKGENETIRKKFENYANEQRPIVNNVSVCKIELEEKFEGTGKEFLFKLFVDEAMIRRYTGDNAKCEAKENGKFEIFDGNVHGTFIDITPEDSIRQKWRNKTWPSDHYSVVDIQFIQDNTGTTIKLTQSGVPCAFRTNTQDGWRSYYFNRIKSLTGNTVGYGM
ncbi:hypothetical protein SNEBB_010089 [Seison nebaliae]|nr:hypothetical protein SNEBB_010089 [Seison nebaliae]